MSSALPDAVVLDYILATLGAKVRNAIRTCSARGYGEARAVRELLVAAVELDVREAVLLAAFGFLRCPPGHYADVTVQNPDAELEEMGLLPKDDAPVIAAFALSRAVHNDGGAFLAD